MNKISQCDILILSGGLGSRLKSEVGDAQKTMADVGGKPFMDIIMQHVISQGFTRVILCTGYNAQSVEDYYKNKDLGIKIEFSREIEKLGTGGAIKNAANLVESDYFFAMNGDSFCPLDFSAFIQFHSSKNASASIAISKVNNVEDYGSILIDDQTKQITFFGEKIKRDAADIKDKQSFVNNGIYCFKKDIFDSMPQENQFSIEEDFFKKLAGSFFYGFEVDQNFIDIGIPERYKEAKQKYSDQE